MNEQTGALAIHEKQTAFSLEQKNALLNMTGLSSIDDATLIAFLHVCQKRGLDPFARQIYLIGREDRRAGITKYTVQTSIDGFRIISQRSHQYAGMSKTEWCGQDGEWKDVWLDKKTPPAAARVGVMRKGFTEPLYATAVFDSYCPRFANGDIISPLWKTMPEVMIAKCAEALARRQAFPEDLSGLYTDDEMEQADAEEVTETKTERPAVTKVVEAEVVEVVPLTQEELDAIAKYANDILLATSVAQLGVIFGNCASYLDIKFTSLDGVETSLRDALTAQARYIRANQEEESELNDETK